MRVLIRGGGGGLARVWSGSVERVRLRLDMDFRFVHSFVDRAGVCVPCRRRRGRTIPDPDLHRSGRNIRAPTVFLKQRQPNEVFVPTMTMIRCISLESIITTMQSSRRRRDQAALGGPGVHTQAGKNQNNQRENQGRMRQERGSRAKRGLVANRWKQPRNSR